MYLFHSLKLTHSFDCNDLYGFLNSPVLVCFFGSKDDNFFYLESSDPSTQSDALSM